MPHVFGAVGAPNAGHHRWKPHSRRPLFVGRGQFSPTARWFLHEIRWRKGPPEYGLRLSAGTFSVLVHVAAFLVFALARPVAHAPPSTATPQEARVEVRLISQPQPPLPPPVKPTPRHAREPARHVPPAVKQAPVAAMPPIPHVSPTRPEIKPTPEHPRQIKLAPVQAAPVQQAAASPAPENPTPKVKPAPPPPAIVPEKSAMAISPPTVDTTELAHAELSSPALAPIPTRRHAPTVTLGNRKLEKVQPESSPDVPQASLHAEASMPPVPAAKATKPAVRWTHAPALKAVPVEPVTPAVTEAPPAQVAQAPQPTHTKRPALDLPVARVTVPQAPRVKVSPVHVSAAPVASARSSTPAPAASASHVTSATRKAAAANAGTSFDRFQPISGKPGAHERAGASRGGEQGRVERLPQGNSDVMSRRSDKLGYKPTMFDQYWAPRNETILGAFLRHFIEKLTVKHTFHVAPGVRVHCVLGPLSVFLACGGDAPRPGAGNSDDRRLNMAPARSLAPAASSSRPAGSPIRGVPSDNSAMCETARVSGSLPPAGCPGGPPASSRSSGPGSG